MRFFVKFSGKMFFRKLDFVPSQSEFSIENPLPPKSIENSDWKGKKSSFRKKHFSRKFEKISIFSINFFRKFEKNLNFFWKKYVLFLGTYRCCSKTATRAYQNLLARIACHRNSDAHKNSPDISYENKRSSREKRTFFEILQIFLLKIEDASEKIRKNQKRLENLGNFVPKQILMMNTWINHKPAIMSVRPHLGYQTIRIC